MTTTGLDRGIQADDFAPFQSDPPTVAAGDPQIVYTDGAGQKMIRGPVLTDEGAWREMFATNPFVAPQQYGTWVTRSTGGVLAVAAGVATFTGNLTPNGRLDVSIPVDILPLGLALHLITGVARPGVANSPDFYWGFYSDPDPDVAIASGEFAECVWQGSGLLTSGQMRCGVGGNLETLALAGLTSSSTASFREILLTLQSNVWREGAITLPTATVRGTQSVKTPEPRIPLNFAMGFRNNATPASAWSVQCRAIVTNNTNIITTRLGL